MKKKRIVVTGMGVVSAFGTDVDEYYDHLLKGDSCVSAIESFPCQDYPTRFAGCIKGFDPGEYVHKKLARRVDPFILYGIVAGKKALENGHLIGDALDKMDKKRAGVLIGSGMGGMSCFYDGAETILTKGFKRLSPFFVPSIITNMSGALLAIDVGFQGPNYSISTACATSNYTILAAAEEILLGNADLMLCGGSEAPMNPVGVGGFVASKVLSTRNEEPTKASRPWDKGRDGFVVGEGSGVLILEDLDHALERKAPIFAEFMGGAKNCDAYHMTDPRPDGSIVAECIVEAIKKAGLTLSDINYINAHATSTIVGDMCEIRALKKVFQELMKDIKINATKSMIGHCLGAAGAMEAIATVQAIRTGMLHPTINLENPEEELEGIDTVSGKAKPHKIKAAMSTSFGFGGHNSVLIFAPYVA